MIENLQNKPILLYFLIIWFVYKYNPSPFLYHFYYKRMKTKLSLFFWVLWLSVLFFWTWASAQPVITFDWAFPSSRATVWPDTTTNGDCNHPGIVCSGTIITVLSWYFQEVGDHFWRRAQINWATEIIIEENNFITVGQGFMYQLLRNSGSNPLEKITFSDGSLQTVWGGFMGAFLSSSTNSSITSLSFPDNAFQSVWDRFMEFFMVDSTNSSIASLSFPDNAFQSVGSRFMDHFMVNASWSQLTWVIFGSWSLQNVWDDFMKHFMTNTDNQLEEVRFWDWSLITVWNGFMSYFMEHSRNTQLSELIFPDWSFQTVGDLFMLAFMANSNNSSQTSTLLDEVSNSLMTIVFWNDTLLSVWSSFMRDFMDNVTNPILWSLTFGDWSLATVWNKFLMNANLENVTTLTFGDGSIDGTIGYTFLWYGWLVATAPNLLEILWLSTARLVEQWVTIKDKFPSVERYISNYRARNLNTNTSWVVNTVVWSAGEWDIVFISKIVENLGVSAYNASIQWLFGEMTDIYVWASWSGEFWTYYKVFDTSWFVQGRIQ